MTTKPLRIRKAAVLGAGVMGAQIAAHLTNAGIETVLFDLPAKDGPKNAVAVNAIKHLGKLKPAPLGEKSLAAAIVPADYDEHLGQLADCDLVIEAIAERMDWKLDLYKKVAAHLPEHAVIASNTSGLSINTLAEALPENLRHRFCGVHFFNPPRYMHLVELIPNKATDAGVLEGLEGFLTTALGKGVVIARDTPNFIGNRIGVFSMLSTMYHTTKSGLGFDVVDALTGPAIGRPKSATYRTADVVGLDTMAHVIQTMADTLPDDPWHKYFKAPEWLAALIEQGRAGPEGRRRLLPQERQDHRGAGPGQAGLPPVRAEGLRRGRRHPRHQGPGREVRQAARQRGSAGAVPVGLLPRPVPLHRLPPGRHRRDRARRRFRHPLGLRLEAGSVRDLAGRGLAAGGRLDRRGHRRRQGHERCAPARLGQRRPPRRAPRRRLVLARAGQGPAALVAPGLRAPAVPRDRSSARRRPRAPRCGRTTACACGPWARTASASCRSRPRCTPSTTHVLDGIQQAIHVAEDQLDAMVIWQPDGPFSAGADLKGALGLLQDGKLAQFEAMIANFQATSMAIKYAQVPVVAAVRGLCLGGGCEFQMHSARTVAAFESYIGLVEAGVGLLPAGGGLKEIATRCSAAPVGDAFDNVKRYFETVAMAKVAGSALEAQVLRPAARSPTWWCSTTTSCCTWPSSRPARWPSPATARPCPRAT